MCSEDCHKESHTKYCQRQSELDRLDLQHHIFSLLFNGKLHFAPVKSPQRILDWGTGTGIWAIDIAEEFPSAEVIGTDLSPIQPKGYYPSYLKLIWVDLTLMLDPSQLPIRDGRLREP